MPRTSSGCRKALGLAVRRMGRAGIEPATLGLKFLHHRMNPLATSTCVAQPCGFSAAGSRGEMQALDPSPYARRYAQSAICPARLRLVERVDGEVEFDHPAVAGRI